MADVLSVPPERGVLRFVAIPEESLAYNGTTILAEIERFERQQQAEEASIMTKRSLVRGSRRSFTTPKLPSSRPETPRIPDSIADGGSPVRPYLSTYTSATSQVTNGTSVGSKQATVAALPGNNSKPLNGVLKDNSTSSTRQSKRKSLGYNFTSTSSYSLKDAEPMPKVNKRKSILAVFRKS
ncbi:hypothetical protein AAFC00_002646 [Neodothiora populina]